MVTGYFSCSYSIFRSLLSLHLVLSADHVVARPVVCRVTLSTRAEPVKYRHPGDLFGRSAPYAIAGLVAAGRSSAGAGDHKTSIWIAAASPVAGATETGDCFCATLVAATMGRGPEPVPYHPGALCHCPVRLAGLVKRYSYAIRKSKSAP